MRIIPAIDIIDGKCVRLTQGNYNTKKIYNEDPLEVAKMIEDSGLKYLHLVDLDGAKNKRITNSRVLEKIAVNTGLIIDFGGGIRSEEDLKIAFNTGASQVTGGSIAVSAPLIFIEWMMKYGNKKIILGADCKNGKVATEGWTENSDLEIIPFISEFISHGLLYSVCTDVDKDGMMKGPATELYKDILRNTEINLIASGGISSIKDVIDIKESGCEGVIIGKAIYEGKIKLKELVDLC